MAARTRELMFARPAHTAAADNYPNFSQLLGPAAWDRLPVAVQARFSSDRHQLTVNYCGTMQRIKASAIGRVIAQISRVFDTPVAPFTGENIDVEVNVYPMPEAHGVVWERSYHFFDRDPVVVRSTKCLDEEGQLIESLGRGLRMKLTLTEDNGALRFTSTGYYFECRGVRLNLPNWLSPGVTHVIHKDEGHGRFRFTMRTEHPWFGLVFFQDGLFEDKEPG